MKNEKTNSKVCVNGTEYLETDNKSKSTKNFEPVVNKFKLTSNDWIVDAFFNKYKYQESDWVLKEENLPEVITAVNSKGVKDWTMLGWAVQAEIVDLNIRKSNKKVPRYDTKPMDSEGINMIKGWAAEKEMGL